MLVGNLQELHGKLVGGLVAMNFDFSHSYWVSIIIPKLTFTHIFFRGVAEKPPTGQELHGFFFAAFCRRGSGFFHQFSKFSARHRFDPGFDLLHLGLQLCRGETDFLMPDV